MVLTELAWDEDEQARRLHLLVVDASASMRGEREVFARGLTVALSKKLQVAGEEVRVRFFDSRLYDAPGSLERGHLPAAWLLSFKGERGRNPARVFAQLATDLALLRTRDARDPVVHVITHAALHVPRPLVQEVRRLAHLFGVFILPSGGALDLEWLDLLEGHAVVDHATLAARGARRRRASSRRPRASMAPAP